MTLITLFKSFTFKRVFLTFIRLLWPHWPAGETKVNCSIVPYFKGVVLRKNQGWRAKRWTDVWKEYWHYQVRRSPRAELRMTTRHSEWWRLCQRSIQGPSTSVVTVPLWQNTFITHIWPLSLCCWPLTLIYRWQYTHISFAHIVWVFVYVSGQAKITDLHHIVIGQQDVSGSKVTMNALKTWKTFVIQPCSYSHSHTLMLTGGNFTLREARNSIPLATWKL